MAMRSVGALGIDVRPDASDFNRELKRELDKAAKRHKVEIPVEYTTKATKNGDKPLKDKLRDTRDEIDNLVKRNNIALRVPLEPDAKDTRDKIKDRVKEINKVLDDEDAIRLPVRFDNEQIARDVRKAIDDAQRAIDTVEETLVVKVELDDLKLREDWEDLRSDLNGQGVDIKADLDRQGHVRTQLATLTRNRFVDLSVRINKRSLATAQATLAALTGENLIRSIGLNLERFATNLDRYAMLVGQWGTVGANLASTVLASVSAVSGVAAGLGQLGGYALSLPAFGASLAAFVTAGVMAFKNFKTAMDDPIGMLDQLPEQAQRAVAALKGTYTEIQKPVQKNFWMQLDGAFENLVNNVFPDIKLGMQGVGTEAGRMLRTVIDSFTKIGGTGYIPQMFDNLNQGIRNATQGTGAFMGAIIELGSAGSQYLPDMGKWFAEMSMQFRDWVTRSQDNGNIQRWMDNARTAAHDLGQVFIDVTGIGRGMMDIFRASGAGDLTSFADTVGRIRDVVNSPVFQSTMTNIFSGAHEAIGLVKDGLGQLGYAMYDVAPTLREILVLSGDSLGAILGSLGEAIKQDAFTDGLGSLFEGINGGLVTALQDLPRVAKGLGGVGGVMGELFKNLFPVAGDLFGDVADIFSDMGPTLEELTPVLAGFAGAVANLATGGLGSLMSIVTPLLGAFADLPSGVQNAILALLALSRFSKGSGANGINAYRQGVQDTNRELGRVPRMADQVRESFRRPLGDNFMSPRAFRPFVDSLRSLPSEVRGAMRNVQTAAAPERIAGGLTQALRDIPKTAAQAYRSAWQQSLAPPPRESVAGLRDAMRGLGQDAVRSLGGVARSVGDTFRRELPAAMKAGFDDARIQARGFAQAVTPGMVRDFAGDASAIARNYARDFREGLANGLFKASAIVQGPVMDDMRRLGQSAANAYATGVGAVRGYTRSFVVEPVQAGLREAGLAARLTGTQIADGVRSGLAGVRDAASRMGSAIRDGVTISPTALGIRNLMQSGVIDPMREAALNARVQGGLMRSNFVDGVSNLADRVRPHIAAVRSTTSSVLSGLGTSISNAFSPMVSSVQNAGQRAMSGLGQAVTSGLGTVKAGFSGLFSFIGGGWGLAFAALFPLMADAAQQTQKVESAARNSARAIDTIATAALQAGEEVDGLAAKAAQLDQLKQIFAMDAGVGFGDSGSAITLGDQLRNAGLGFDELIGVMQGQGSDEALNKLKTMRDLMRQDGDVWAPFGWGDNGDLLAGANQLDGMIRSAEETKKQLEELWKTEPGRAQGIVGAFENIKKASDDGKVSLENIKGIKANVYGTLLDDNAKLEQFATGISTSMGGGKDAVERYFSVAVKSLQDYEYATGKLDNGAMRGLIQDLLDSGAPIHAVKAGLEQMGYSAEEATKAILFRFGPAVNGNGSPFTVLGEQVPKLSEASTGLHEYAEALGAAAGIDPQKLYQAMTLNGTDPAAMAVGLGQMGVGVEQIAAAMEAAGISGPGASAALAIAAEAAGKLAREMGNNPENLLAFSTAIEGIRDSADDATTKAEGLLGAMDKLNGGFYSSSEITSTFHDAVRELDDFNKAAEGTTSNLDVLNLAFEDSTGNLDASVRGFSDVSKAMSDLSTGAMAQYIDAYDEEIKKSGDSVKAREEARKSIGALDPALDSLRAKLEEANGSATITDEAWQNFLKTVGLTPDQVEVTALAQTDGALGKLAELDSKLRAVNPGVSIEVTALTDQAVSDLRAMDLIVEKGPNGTYTVKTSADPAEAQAQLNKLDEYVKTNPVTQQIDVAVDVPKARAELQARIDEANAAGLSVELTPDDARFLEYVTGINGLSERVASANASGIPVKLTPEEQKLIEEVAGITGLQAPVDGDTTSLVEKVFGVNGTQVFADVGGDIARGILDVLELNGLKVEADVGGDISRAISDISVLDGLKTLTDTGADVGRATFDILGLNGTEVQAQAKADIGQAFRDIFRLNGTQVQANAGANTGQAQRDINNLNGQRVFVEVVAQGLSNFRNAIAAINPFRSANGNFFPSIPAGRMPNVRQYANGGIESHVAQIAKGSTAVRIWAEPETGGEAYIPLSPAKRGRSMKILSDVAEHFGYKLERIAQRAVAYENGGTQGTPVGGGGGSNITVINNNPTVERDSVSVTKAAQLLAARGEW